MPPIFVDYLLRVEAHKHTITRESLPDIRLNTCGDMDTPITMDPCASSKNVAAVTGIAGCFITRNNRRCLREVTLRTLKPDPGFETPCKDIITNFVPYAFPRGCCLTEETWGPFWNIRYLTDHTCSFASVFTDSIVCNDIHCIW